jgi:uncharacterized delta-60 repeat protein
MALQRDGKLVVAGRTSSRATLQIGAVVARLDERGELDPTFAPGGSDGSGKVILSESRYLSAEAVALRPGGGIALALTDALYDAVAVRVLKPDGSPGDVNYDALAPAGSLMARAIANAPDGKLVVAAKGYETEGPAVIARWNPDGKLDVSFAGTGKTTVAALGESADLFPLPDGRVAIAGGAPGQTLGTLVVRLKEDGELDPSFGDGGVARLDFAGYDQAVGAALQPDGKVVVGVTATNEYVFGAARVTSAGELDPTFGTGGKATFLREESAGALSAALAPDGRFVVAGATVTTGLTLRLTVLRLLADRPPVVNGGPVGGGGGGGPAPDTQPPALSGLRVTRKVAGNRPRIALTLSEPARVRLVLKRRDRRAQRFTVDAVSGTNRVRTPRRLKRGRYRLNAVATDAAGNASAPARARFRMRAAR